MNYGTAPQIIGSFDLYCTEMMFVQYMPIRLPDTLNMIPPQLQWVEPVINTIMGIENLDNKYIYVTAKQLYVEPGCMGNRMGWHSDGFGTDDINYIWCDRYPTEFCIQPFKLSTDCDLSQNEMRNQAKKENIVTYPAKTLLRLTQENIHRIPYILIDESGLRTFLKISISTEKYNLIGNARNYFLQYRWEMKPRDAKRNHPSK
jgi:hypothetical protein